MSADIGNGFISMDTGIETGYLKEPIQSTSRGGSSKLGAQRGNRSCTPTGQTIRDSGSLVGTLTTKPTTHFIRGTRTKQHPPTLIIDTGGNGSHLRKGQDPAPFPAGSDRGDATITLNTISNPPQLSGSGSTPAPEGFED